MFGGLSNLDLLEFAIRHLKDPFEAETMRSSLSPQLSTIQQTANRVWEYMSNYALSLLTPRFYDKNISTKIKAKFGLEIHPW